MIEALKSEHINAGIRPCTVKPAELLGGHHHIPYPLRRETGTVPPDTQGTIATARKGQHWFQLATGFWKRQFTKLLRVVSKIIYCDSALNPAGFIFNLFLEIIFNV